MVVQFSDVEIALGVCDPFTWHHTMHNPSGICSRMKLYYCSQADLKRMEWMFWNCEGEWTTEVMDEAASNGHVDIAQWLQRHLPESGCTTEAMDGAARNGHFEMVKWLHEQRSEGCSSAAMIDAASNGHLKVVLYLLATVKEPATNASVAAAAANGHYDAVRFLHENLSEPCSADGITFAGENGHMDVFEYLLQHEGCREAHEKSYLNGAMAVVNLGAMQPNSLGMSESLTPRTEGVEQAENCPVCWEDLYEPVTTACRHTFCMACILQSLERNDKCPMCRQVVLRSDLSAANISNQLSERASFSQLTSSGVGRGSESGRARSSLRPRCTQEANGWFTITVNIEQLQAEAELYPWPSSPSSEESDDYQWPSPNSPGQRESNRWPSPTFSEESFFAGSIANNFQSEGDRAPVDDVCSICHDDANVAIPTACGHSFCVSCLRERLRNADTCPVCWERIV